MQAASGLKISGFFHCKIFSDGQLIKEFSEKNLVVNVGKQRLIDGMQTGFLQPINRIGFGVSSEAPQVTNQKLSDPTFFKNITAIVIPEKDPDNISFSIRYDWFLGTSEANGLNIQEFGLCFPDTQLFARKVGITVAKTPSITLTGSWTINIE